MPLSLHFALAFAALGGCGGEVQATSGACDEAVEVTGQVTIGGGARAPVGAMAWMDHPPGGACVSAVRVSLDLGGECSLWLVAEGADSALPILRAEVYGAEDCGLDGSGWVLADAADSAMALDGALEDSGDSETFCFEGALSLSIDVTLERDGAAEAVTGAVDLVGRFAPAVDDDATCGP